MQLSVRTVRAIFTAYSSRFDGEFPAYLLIYLKNDAQCRDMIDEALVDFLFASFDGFRLHGAIQSFLRCVDNGCNSSIDSGPFLILLRSCHRNICYYVWPSKLGLHRKGIYCL